MVTPFLRRLTRHCLQNTTDDIRALCNSVTRNDEFTRESEKNARFSDCLRILQCSIDDLCMNNGNEKYTRREIGSKMNTLSGRVI